MDDTEANELDRALFIASALRGYRLQRMQEGYYGLFRRDGDALHLVASRLTVKDVANRCGAFGPTTLKRAAERDGLGWPTTFEAFLALIRTV